MGWGGTWDFATAGCGDGGAVTQNKDVQAFAGGLATLYSGHKSKGRKWSVNLSFKTGF